MAFAYTFETSALFDAATDSVVENATGGKFVAVFNGPALPIGDLNDNPIASLTSNASGQIIQFKANARRGLVQFGTVAVNVWAIEVAAELDALDAYMASINTAVAAAQTAAATAVAAAGSGTGTGSLPAGTTLDAIPNGTTRLAFTQTERDKLQLIAAGATNTTIGVVNTTTGLAPAGTAKPGDWMPTPVQVGAPQNVAGFGRVWGRTAAQGLPTVAEGLQTGDYVMLDAT